MHCETLIRFGEKYEKEAYGEYGAASYYSNADGSDAALFKQGDAAACYDRPPGSAGMLAWGMESLAIVAVNVYMLISGYFLTEGRFRTGRLIQLICQVLFYSILVTAVLLCTDSLSFQT